MAVVEVNGVHRRYGSLWALRGVSFAIEPGEIVGLLGPNGAGKSTTMKILTGYLSPSEGTASVCGFDTMVDPLGVRRCLGYLPESAPVYGDMTVRGYLHFVGQARGLRAAERARAVERVVEECGLGDRLTQLIGTLSRGYKQRVGLAQALIHGPKLLILDEPTNGLDPNQIVEIRQLIRRIGETRTVILSTHILHEVQVTCGRVLIIHQGRLVADGPTEHVMSGAIGHQVTVGLAHGKVVPAPGELVAGLRQIAGVSDVREVGELDTAHRFELVADRDVREDVFRFAVERGHVLVELAGRRSNLEDVFRRLTQAEGQAPAA